MKQSEKLPLVSLLQFMEGVETGTDRSTFYNAALQQQLSLDALHRQVFDGDRELYCLVQTSSIVNDYNKLLATRNLLFQTGYVNHQGGKRTFVRYGKGSTGPTAFGVTPWECDWITLENYIITDIVWKNIPIPRLLREWVRWRKERLNNSRSKKLLLKFLLVDSRFESWALKYSPNLKRVLSHAWENARTRRIIKESQDFLKDCGPESTFNELNQWVFGFCCATPTVRRSVCESICFIYHCYNQHFNNPQFSQYVAAISDPGELPGLPYDLALGLRNRVHAKFPRSRLLESDQTIEQMPLKQKARLQRSANREQVKLAMNLSRLPLVDILRYGYSMGFNSQVRSALSDRSSHDAKAIPFRMRHVAIVMDTSQPMKGKADRKLYPIAVAMSMSLVMKHLAQKM